jgi:hypothetical protein
MPIIKFVAFLVLTDNTQTESLFFKARNIFVACCIHGVPFSLYLLDRSKELVRECASGSSLQDAR